jgi:hypothetical protein
MSRNNTAAYIAETSIQLSALAKQNGLVDLAYVLTVAAVAAEEHTALPARGRRAAGPKGKSTRNVIDLAQRRDSGNDARQTSA